jgi:hypothetical protein
MSDKVLLMETATIYPKYQIVGSSLFHVGKLKSSLPAIR